MASANKIWDAIIVGGGIAGLSAAIYLGRALRKTLVIDAERSLARWEPEVHNYLGFPEGIDGRELLRRGRKQAEQFHVSFAKDEIEKAANDESGFWLRGKNEEYRCHRLLLATGLFHLPPKLPRVTECLGHTMFFCKDCDGWRVKGKRIAIIGNNNEAVEYALGMMFYSPCVVIATNGERPHWDEQHAAWLEEYKISFFTGKIMEVCGEDKEISELHFESGQAVLADALFTTHGDIFHNDLAKELGAELDSEGQVEVDSCMKTNVQGLYAAGCVTPANCQMIIAAGQGAAAAQAINRDIFAESLATHKLRRFREGQLQNEETEPEMVSKI
ncbi:MAG: NAD(P)/FAD-dependent oxidoreductase [Verrucomicrobia bacterium]|nr:NAD(P)/FAD-dependent oxidoreductase [Verrucomicrobiota bacterium]